MTCINYNDSISYNSFMPYNGQCISPPTPPSNIAGGFVNHPYHRKKIYADDDFAIVLSILELLDEE